MTLLKVLFLAVFSVLISIQAMANKVEQDQPINTNEWKVVEQGKTPYAVSTWVRNVDGAAIKEFRGGVIIKRPIAEVLLLIDDAENLAEWVFFAEIVNELDPQKFIWNIKEHGRLNRDTLPSPIKLGLILVPS